MLRPLEGLLERRVSWGDEKSKVRHFAKAAIRPAHRATRVRQARAAEPAAAACDLPWSAVQGHTYLGGDGIFCSGVCLRVLSLLSLLLLLWLLWVVVGLVDASEASVDRAGS